MKEARRKIHCKTVCRSVKALGASAVVMAFDENGQADTLIKVNISARAYNH